MSPGLGMQQNGRCGVQLITAFPTGSHQGPPWDNTLRLCDIH